MVYVGLFFKKYYILNINIMWINRDRELYLRNFNNKIFVFSPNYYFIFESISSNILYICYKNLKTLRILENLFIYFNCSI